MRGFWETLWSPPKKAHLKSCMPSGIFFFLEHTHKRKKVVFSQRKLYPFFILTWIQIFVLTQLWERQGPRKGRHVSWKIYCIDKEKGSCTRESSENPSPAYAACMLLALLLSSERFLLRKLTKFSVLLERQILNSVSCFHILLYECD